MTNDSMPGRGDSVNDLLRNDFDPNEQVESDLFGSGPGQDSASAVFDTPRDPFAQFEEPGTDGSAAQEQEQEPQTNGGAGGGKSGLGSLLTKSPATTRKKDKSPKGTKAAARDGVVGKVLSFFTAGPDQQKEGSNGKGGGKGRKKGHTRNGLSYTRRTGFQYITIGLLCATLVFSLLAFAVALSKPDQGAINSKVKSAVAQSGRDYPTGSAVQFAGQVLRVWGTWNEDNSSAHQVNIAPYLSSGMDPQGGWNGEGNQSVEYAVMNPEPTVVDKHRALVSGTYQIQDGTWRCVTIPVYAYHQAGTSGGSSWAFALSASPAPTPCAPRTGAAQVDNYNLGANMQDDQDVDQTLQQTFFPGFMAAWGASDTDGLNQYTTSGVTLTGLGGAVESTPQPTISEVHLFYSGDSVAQNKTYKTVATVAWTVKGSQATITATYVVPLKKTGDRWYAAGEPQPVSQDSLSTSGAPGSINQPGSAAKSGGFASSDPTPSSAPPTANPGSSASSSSPRSSSPAKKPAKKPSKKAKAPTSKSTKKVKK